MDTTTAVAALVAELRRQSRDNRRSDQPPFVGPTDVPSLVYVQGQLDLEAMARALTTQSAEDEVLA